MMTEHTPDPCRDDLYGHLAPAEQAGLDALCDAVTEEIGDQRLWYGASDLTWILESALFQAGQMIRRTEQPLSLPGLGTFRRHPLAQLDSGETGHLVSFEPDPMILEDAL